MHFLYLASVTGALATWAQDWVISMGVGGVFLLMLLDCACIPIPSEVTMLFAGFGVSEGKYGLIAIILAGVLGNLAGSLISYGVGYAGVERFRTTRAGRALIHDGPLERAHAWFDRYGNVSVLVSRCLPVVRTFISLPAGIAEMPIVRFTVFTVLGCIPWVAALGILGDAVGHDWVKWRDNFHYLDDLVIAAIVLGAAYLIYRRVQRRRLQRVA